MMGDYVHITTDNIGVFVPVFVDAFNAPPWNNGWSSDAAAERLRSFCEYPLFCGIGFVINTAPVALALGWGERWSRGWVFHLKELCVAVAFQHRGIGKKLLWRLEQELAAQHYKSVYLEASRDAATCEFYATCGYEGLDLISLRKSLSASRETKLP